MVRFIGALLVILVTFAACSRATGPHVPGSESPVLPSGPSAPSESWNSDRPFDPSTGVEVWGEVEVLWNPTTGEVSVDQRSLDLDLRHFKVSYFLTSPRCDDCIVVSKLGNDPLLGTGTVEIELRNPTKLWGYDVRGVLRIDDGVNLRLLNADGYTTLFETKGYQYPAPFRTFARQESSHGFGPGAVYAETYELKTDPGSAFMRFTLLVMAGHPSPAGDVSRLWSFRQWGQLLPGGGTAKVSFEIEDLQGDIGGVLLDMASLGTGDVWLLPTGGRWEAWIQNFVAQPGLYELRVDAFSPNMQSGVTSHLYKAVVFPDRNVSRSELLALMNADRAKEGVGSLVLDPYLNTVAQSHAQDMADKQYFNHTNLDGWSPWLRLEYYGVEFRTGGENIAVGQDSASEVEKDWMNSSGHRKNILNTSFNQVGLGIAEIQPGDPYQPGYYWVQLFTD